MVLIKWNVWYESRDELPPSLGWRACRGFSPTAHHWTALFWVMMTQMGQIWLFWNLQESRIRLILFFPGKNVFFLKRQIFLLHFFTEEINIFRNLFAEIKFLTTVIDFKWENKNFLQNAEIIADVAIRATNLQMYFSSFPCTIYKTCI